MPTAKTSTGKSPDKMPDRGGDMELQMQHMTSFAEMLRVDVGVRRVLKLPPWLTFPTLYKRKDQASLTAVERQRFLCAYEVLRANGTLGASSTFTATRRTSSTASSGSFLGTASTSSSSSRHCAPFIPTWPSRTGTGPRPPSRPCRRGWWATRRRW